jgi:hypothetical protein
MWQIRINFQIMTGPDVIIILVVALIFEVLFCRWLATTKWSPKRNLLTFAAGIAAVVGPACGALPYTDYLPLFLKDLPGIWLLVAIGAIGLGIGVFALSKGSKVAGTICVVTNIPVLAYWGFVAVFVSAGGGS